ncbi:Signal transduction protein [Mycena kentingensis (nom. inval.)]|nr:Signal transduction protein [Mycena kentingensis (nom. inval.)]
MKFARYLEDTQTPEWQRAYIDYRLLKKRITAIRRAMGHQEPTDSPLSSRLPNPSVASEASIEPPQALSHRSVYSNLSRTKSANDAQTTGNESLPQLVAETSQRREPLHRATTMPAESTEVASGTPSFSRLFSSSNSRLSRRLTQLGSFGLGTKPHPYSELPLRELYPLLSPLEMAFFTTLDAELEKIEKFYVERERYMKNLSGLLEEQLAELDQHRKLFNAAHPASAWASAINTNALLRLKARILPEDGLQSGSQTPATSRSKGKHPANGGGSKEHGTPASSSSDLSLAEPTVDQDIPPPSAQLNPNDFQDAKHKLKKAVMEHYRGLEMLQNYRILNLTGIRKALKKFQKVTKISVQKAYMAEKVDKMTFASAEDTIRSMMDKTEAMYAARFTFGDKKKALARLRLGPVHKSHHVSTFWSGLQIGLALPALASGLYYSFQESTRTEIPGWDALLLVYAVFLVPTLFVWMVGVNVLVWSHARVNYIFIFEFDLRTRMDHREYFEIPSFLFATLCGAFWLSFSRFGTISPTLWPVIWLAFAGAVVLNPLPVFFKPSRFWLVRAIGKLLTSGTRQVEFADFWLGDQLCSLVFTLSNLCFVACLYEEGFTTNWRRCGSKSSLWPLSFVLATLPFLIRLVQSIKRYVDSGLDTHMVNAGKYASGIVAYLCYFIWRHKGGGFGPAFIAWCIFQTMYSFYALGWDLFMDWSLGKLNERYPLLRKDLLFSDHVYLYYLAIISNTLLRFVWVIYIPTQGPDMMLRAFIAALCEIFRRWQWNFYRLENEQMGNRDMYRATRDVPLPYSLDERQAEREDEELSAPPKWRSLSRTTSDSRLKSRTGTSPSQSGFSSFWQKNLKRYLSFPPMDEYLASSRTNQSGSRPSEPRKPFIQKRCPYACVNVLLLPSLLKKYKVDPLRKHPYATLSLHALVPLLSPQELGFFMALDEEIAKVETFYGDRQKVMKVRSRDLERQLQELDAHRRLFDATHAEPTSSWTNVLSPLDAIGAWLNLPLIANSKPRSGRDPLDNDNGKAQQEYLERVRMEGRLNPEKYHTSKRKLKKAILEHYRALGMLNNYRILNIYAIQRVLAKFEKTTKIPAERAYMAEKVEPTLFYSDDSLRGMMEELGNVFAAGFEQGNKKKATTRLRAGIQHKSHHNSTFSSGLALGSAFAALGAGIVHVASKSTQHAIAGWDGLLFIYGVLAVPVIFALLVGFNVLVWTRTRINFAFIMEHDIRTRLDPREYWQLPSVLFAALCYAFFLSFARIGSPTVSPTIWPLVWLAFMAAVMFDPLPILFKPARFWLLKNAAKQFKSGFKRVEFTDFWLGDQFCSLSFPLSNIPLIICVYTHGFTPEWRKCGNASSLWPLNFILAILPLLVRLVQSFKRYADSGVRAHLTNAGKYGAGCLAQFWYICWRHRGSRYDWTLAVWCLCNVFATSYALTWDFLMDWSILRRHCRHWMLRPELIYANHVPLYYFAIVSNTVLRFLWILYIPARGPDPMLRSFVLGVLEIVRRFQWNFYRLENEQIGNADQYRAHRDVPLPYEIRQDAEDDDAALEKEM